MEPLFGVENEACGRLVSRLWWYKCYRWTLLREGTPPVLGVETKACGRLVSRLWWYKCYRGTLLREGTPPAVCLEHQNVSMSRTSEHQYVQNIRTSVCPEHQNVSMSRTSERQYVKNIRTSVLPPRGEFLQNFRQKRRDEMFKSLINRQQNEAGLYKLLHTTSSLSEYLKNRGV